MIKSVQGVQGVQGTLCRVKALWDVACAGCAGFPLYMCARAQCVILNFYRSFNPCTPCTPCTAVDMRGLRVFRVLHTTLHTCIYPAHLKNNSCCYG